MQTNSKQENRQLSVVYESPSKWDAFSIYWYLKRNIPVWVIEPFHAHHHGDLNIDHQITFKAVMTAFRPVKGETVREMYSFEIPSSTEWNAPIPASYFMPNYFIDVSNTLELKIKAMKEYKSEIRKYPHPRSPEAIRIYARFRGIQVGLEAAEAFEVIRMLR